MPQQLTRSAELLGHLIESGDFTHEQVATELALPIEELASYANGEKAMPLTHQLSLAQFLIDRSPRLARKAHTLRNQVTAAMEFQMRRPSTSSTPPRWESRRRSR